MTSDDPTLSEPERTALQKLMRGVDRGRAPIFVGRQTELELIRERLDLLLERLDEPAPGADLTTVIQGAPGAGKSALLERIIEEWPPGGSESQPVAVRVAAGALEQPMADLLAIMARQTAGNLGIIRTLVRFFRSGSVNVAGLSEVTLGLNPDQLTGQPLTPVILLVDEIQSLWVGPGSEAARKQVSDNLRLLHTGEHGAPVFPVYGGLANSGDLLRAAGLTRLASESERTLSRLSEVEMAEWMDRFVEEHLSSARPAPTILKGWATALQRDSQGWPMHGRNFLIALAEDIRTHDWCPAAADLDAVRARAQPLRFHYYGHRLQGALQNRYVLVSKVLEAMELGPPMSEHGILDAIDRAQQDRPSGDFGLGALPDGLTVRQTFEAMLYAGVVQKTGQGKLACPIPSLASYLVAKATLPPSPLHEAVLDQATADMDRAWDRCRTDTERSALLQATDPRGRTALMLAVELGLVPLVAHLVTLESRLPSTLRSTACQDRVGRTAHDHAMEVGDVRLTTMLDRLLSRESTLAMPE